MTSKPITSTSTPQLPWRTRLFLYLISSVSDSCRRDNGTVNRRLMTFLDIKSPPTPTTPFYSVLSSDVTLDPTRPLSFRLYTPVLGGACDKLPVIIFFHGGGFTFLTACSRNYDIVCRRFAKRTPAVVISVEYRRTPEHKFPSQYDDGFDVLKFLDENYAHALPKEADLSKCFLVGDSAGANIAHHVSVRVCRNPTQFRVLKLAGLISIQPFFGGEERTESETRLVRVPLISVSRTDWHWKVFLPQGSNRDHYVVNVSGPNAEDISGLDYPDTLVFTGGFDPLQDWQRRYYEWLKKSGKRASLTEYPNMIHAFYAFPELPESRELMIQVKDFITARL